MSTRTARNAGGLTLLALGALTSSAFLTCVAEPYADLRAYFEDMLTIFLLVGVVGSVTTIIPYWGAFLILARLADNRRYSEQARRMARAFLLSHLCIAVPLLAWLPFVALIQVANPHFGLLDGKPAWLFEPWLEQIASPWTTLAIMVLWGGNLSLACVRIRRERSDRRIR